LKAYRFLEEADEEFHEQIGYFLGRSLAAAEKFVNEVEAAVRDVREYPQVRLPFRARISKRKVHDAGRSHPSHCAVRRNVGIVRNGAEVHRNVERTA
jgi:plasmid stabilization system protein ParE